MIIHIHVWEKIQNKLTKFCGTTSMFLINSYVESEHSASYMYIVQVQSMYVPMYNVCTNVQVIY